MGLNDFLRYLAGNVTFEAKNGFGERLINLCAGNNIGLWDFNKTPEGFTARCAAKDYKLVKRMSKKVNVEVSVVRKRGLLFVAGRYRKRWGLFAGIAAFFIFIFVSQNFVWEIDISGNNTVPDSVILSELETVGVHKMSFIPSLDFRLQRQEALLKLPQLSYMSINASGCRLKIEVNERVPPPAIQENEPCNIVAARTGQITYMEVYAGQAATGVHYTVNEGDVIVNGAYTTKKGNQILVHADAKVMAEVQFDKTLSVDLNQLSKEYTGVTKKRYYLNLFSLRLPLFIAFPMQGNYDASLQSNPLVLFGQTLPLGIDTAHYRFYTPKPEAMTEESARKVLQDCFLQYELTELKGTAILARKVMEANKNGLYSMTISYTAEQNIARKQVIANTGGAAGTALSP